MSCRPESKGKLTEIKMTGTDEELGLINKLSDYNSHIQQTLVVFAVL